MKIAVIGYSGSGKSTLAAAMGRHYQIPVLHLDRVNFTENWQERPSEDSKKIVEDYLHEDHWIIDGNYRKLLQNRRMNEADLILFLRFNRINCLWRAFVRFLTYRNKTRESAADGCIEKLDFDFIKWILRDGRSKAYQAHYDEVIHAYRDKIIMVFNQRGLNRIYDILMRSPNAEAFKDNVLKKNN